MGIGLGVFLIAAGAVLVWRVDYTLSGFNVYAAGWALMAAGLVVLLLALGLWARRRAAETARRRGPEVVESGPAYEEEYPPPVL